MDRRLVLVLSLLLAGCTPLANSTGATPTGVSGPTNPASAAGPVGCPVTIAFQRPPDEVIDVARAGSSPPMSHDQAVEAAKRTNWAGTDGIWIPLPPDGVVTWGSSTSGSKFPVWSLAAGRVSATARRLDAPTPPGFTSEFGTPEVASSLGFIASGLVFPSGGCWEVSYRVGDARHIFVVDVRR